MCVHGTQNSAYAKLKEAYFYQHGFHQFFFPLVISCGQKLITLPVSQKLFQVPKNIVSEELYSPFSFTLFF